MSLQKWAVDSAAKEYWSSYYKEYGKTWVRDIPRKIRAAMRLTAKTANTEGNAVAGIVSPIGTAITKEAVFLEGLFTPPNGDVMAFYAEFDHQGNVSDFTVVPLNAKTASKPDFLSKSKSKKSRGSKSKGSKPAFLFSKSKSKDDSKSKSKSKKSKGSKPDFLKGSKSKSKSR